MPRTRSSKVPRNDTALGLDPVDQQHLLDGVGVDIGPTPSDHLGSETAVQAAKLVDTQVKGGKPGVVEKVVAHTMSKSIDKNIQPAKDRGLKAKQVEVSMHPALQNYSTKRAFRASAPTNTTAIVAFIGVLALLGLLAARD